MTKKELITQVATATGKTQVDVSLTLEGLISTTGKELAAGNDVVVSGFGSFKSVIRAGRTGTVPGTTKTYSTDDKRVCKFSPAKHLSDTVAG